MHFEKLKGNVPGDAEWRDAAWSFPWWEREGREIQEEKEKDYFESLFRWEDGAETMTLTATVPPPLHPDLVFEGGRSHLRVTSYLLYVLKGRDEYITLGDLLSLADGDGGRRRQKRQRKEQRRRKIPIIYPRQPTVTGDDSRLTFPPEA